VIILKTGDIAYVLGNLKVTILKVDKDEVLIQEKDGGHTRWIKLHMIKEKKDLIRC
jgi:hypothetical protein